jgi:HSP20 family molecular chaperone IbpA
MKPQNTPATYEPVADRPVVRPSVDIYENQDELLLIVDLPGVHSDAISVDLDKEILTIQAQRADAMPDNANVAYGELANWDYKRVFTVPLA